MNGQCEHRKTTSKTTGGQKIVKCKDCGDVLSIESKLTRQQKGKNQRKRH